MLAKAHLARDLGIIGDPVGIPLRADAQRCRGEQDVLAESARGKLLLPFRDLHMRRSTRDDGEDERRSLEELRLEVEAVLAMIGMERMPALAHDLAKSAARIALEQDETPGRELAMVGYPHRDGEDALQLFISRPRPGHRLDRSGLAGLEEGKDGGRVVEGGHGGLTAGGPR